MLNTPARKVRYPMKLRPVWFGMAIAVVACVGVSAGGQEPKDPPAKQKTPEKGDAVVVKGCLDGPTLQSIETVTTDDTGKVSGPLTYRLTGDKKLLKQLRAEHDGKVVEVSGILKSNLPHDSSIHAKTMGKTKITLGVGTPSGQKGMPGLESSLPVLQVKSYDGSGAPCFR
jgi:hypothetical protein